MIKDIEFVISPRDTHRNGLIHARRKGLSFTLCRSESRYVEADAAEITCARCNERLKGLERDIKKIEERKRQEAAKFCYRCTGKDFKDVKCFKDGEQYKCITCKRTMFNSNN